MKSERVSESTAAAKEVEARRLLLNNRDVLQGNPSANEAITDSLRLTRLRREIAEKKNVPQYAAASNVVESIAGSVEELYSQAGYSNAEEIADSAMNLYLRQMRT